MDKKQAFMVPVDSRLHQMIVNYRLAQMAADVGWGMLLNTKKHQRLVEHREKMFSHIVWYINTFSGMVDVYWHMESMGSDKYTDVKLKLNQKFLIIED